MISFLSARFRRHIALMLYCIFYAQLITAAEMFRANPVRGDIYSGNHSFLPHSGSQSGPFNRVTRSLPADSMVADSSINPARHAIPQDRLHRYGAIPTLRTIASADVPEERNALRADLSLKSAGSSSHLSIGGPTQPEMQSFQSVNSNNMVDLFSGDFSYNIPLLDVGGYPVNIAYHSGQTMDADASWVGLGWNVNPGSITRNMRGIPDDFNGWTDTIKKVANIKPNFTWGANFGGNLEVLGLPTVDVGEGLFHSTYAGWGMELSLNASISAGLKSAGSLTGGLSLKDNSQSGVTIAPSLSAQFFTQAKHTEGSNMAGLNLSLPYNSRTGIKGLQLGLTDSKTINNHKEHSGWNTSISFAYPTYNPTISMPMTNYNYTFTAKYLGEIADVHPNLYLMGYVSREYVDPSDQTQSIPAYGYLNYQNRGSNWAAITDFNREKEMAYREKPAIPHIGVPAYTYDVFNISGEGTGGMFRAYRGDIGFIADPLVSSKTRSGEASIDIGTGNMVHGGTDLNANYSVTRTGPWLQENTLSNTLDFQKSNGLFESVYFRNPGEKAINTTAFYNAIGGDNVAVAALSQPGGNSDPSIMATNNLALYSGKQQVGSIPISKSTAIRNTRDKRSEVISYLTASEASVVGLDKYINHYNVNEFGFRHCINNALGDTVGNATGMVGYYYANNDLQGTPAITRVDKNVNFNFGGGSPFSHGAQTVPPNQEDDWFPHSNYSVRWLGRLKAPATGKYTFAIYRDDGVRLWVNDSLVLDQWVANSINYDKINLNLVGGKFYDIRLEYYQLGGSGYCEWDWIRPDVPPGNGFVPDDRDSVNSAFLYQPVVLDTARVDSIITRENRVNNFRKASHISEIDVLNPDGRKYVYGIPVYNLIQKEVSFSVTSGEGNVNTGLTSYDSVENSTLNNSGKEGYYSREEIPAYAHSFLLTGILSPDYVDVTGDGISDDDIGDAVKFNYSKTSGIANPFGWRAPYATGSATYNEGLRSYNRDDKGNYIYGTKELWYLHSIESKTMVATFTLQSRADLLESDEQGRKTNNGKGMCLKQIDLYSKADYIRNGPLATPIKTVHFDYSYELCRGINLPVNDSGKLTLKRIWFSYNGNNKGVVNPYLFNYHPNNPNYQSNSNDKWGTYKNPSQNPGYTSANPINNAEYPYALQDSTAAAYNAGAWTLDSIQLPSGGRIKVNYESDDYAYVQNKRAAQMCKIVGFGTGNTGSYNSQLYGNIQDNLYAYVRVPYSPVGNKDLYARYLDGITKLYFRLYVGMPTDDFGSGSEYVPCYATPDTTAKSWYGTTTDPNVIWIKIKGVNSTGDGDGMLSPLTETALNFLRLNLPSKAYPGSELDDGLNLQDGIKILLSMAGNISDLINGYENRVRGLGWARDVDTSRSFVRLNCPILKKYGGGLRVKSILIYDNWNAMTGKRETVYGQTYDYTTTQSVNGVPTAISSGVAAWEPGVGSEENPFHLPIEYVDQSSMLAPATAMYTEEPLGEAFYPGASVGYSNVRVRSIHSAGTRSANGFTETSFYTSYDFPTTWDWSMIDNNTKKRYKPFLSNFLRINAKNYLAISQGFKVELNDMNGKLRREAVYAATDTANLISLTENFYKVDNATVQFKHLKNSVTAIDPFGNIDTAATIGKDAELMADMREQTTNTVGGNINVNVDLFSVSALPLALPSLLNLYQHAVTQFRSAGMTKIIQRYGILDSVVHIDKGSLVSSKNLLYDGETGDPILVRTGNEFNDSLFQFSYPAHWAYKGMGPAYQNIGATLSHLFLNSGKITKGLSQPDTTYLVSGDELLVYSKLSIDTLPGCAHDTATFPDAYKLWVVDTNAVHGGSPSLFLVDQYGIPFSGNDVSLKVIRSGHRNQNGAVGSITSFGNPLVADGQGKLHLVFDSTRGVLTAGANEMKQYWKVSDKRRSDTRTSCVSTSLDSALVAGESCSCLAPFFNYLITYGRLYVPKFRHTTVRRLVSDANATGKYNIQLSNCPLLAMYADSAFYTFDGNITNGTYLSFRLGNDILNLMNNNGKVNFYQLTATSCNSLGQAVFKNPTLTVPGPDTVRVNLYPTFSVNLLSSMGSSCPSTTDTLLMVDTTSDHLLVENSLNVSGFNRNAASVIRFDQIGNIPSGANILSAKLILQADQRGHIPGTYNNANSVNPVDSVGYSLSAPLGWMPYLPLDTLLYQAYHSPWFASMKNSSPFQNDTINVASWLSGYINNAYFSKSLILTQGSGPLNTHGSTDSSCAPVNGTISYAIPTAVPTYLMTGYSNYYSTFYSQRYSDPTKWPVIQLTYVVPPPFTDTMGAVLTFNSTVSCTTVTGRTCYSSITDTMVNPYQFGILGDYRPQRGYVYYGRRKESDPTAATNIRRNGTISNFAPFWTLQSGQWSPSYDTTRWVWNSQTTLFNRKGFEVENRDPLGRYNSGQYGYGLTLPTAVIQNSRSQESIFEGFEDYSYEANSCDTMCTVTRPFDFSLYSNNISDSMAHTGLYSLRVATGESVSIPVPIQAVPDTTTPQLNNSAQKDNCSNPILGGIRASNNIILPPFAPFAGKRMLVGAWVKEQNACTCKSYSRDHVQLSFYLVNGDTAHIMLSPSGNMIEGWQRYEATIVVPANATSLLFTLQASDSSTTYFDDIRIHPFNAEMKSYVYNPVNLRLMAELDENNYGTFYEYDDDGTLIRVKKETERGIQTIKETRSALLKNQ